MMRSPYGYFGDDTTSNATPNGTSSLPPGVTYDPTTGNYTGPGGVVYNPSTGVNLSTVPPIQFQPVPVPISLPPAAPQPQAQPQAAVSAPMDTTTMLLVGLGALVAGVAIVMIFRNMNKPKGYRANRRHSPIKGERRARKRAKKSHREKYWTWSSRDARRGEKVVAKHRTYARNDRNAYTPNGYDRAPARMGPQEKKAWFAIQRRLWDGKKPFGKAKQREMLAKARAKDMRDHWKPKHKGPKLKGGRKPSLRVAFERWGQTPAGRKFAATRAAKRKPPARKPPARKPAAARRKPSSVATCRKKPPKGYPKSRSAYALPECFMYPLNTAARTRTASARFGKHKTKYSRAVRAKIAKRIDTAKRRFGIGEYRGR